MTTQAPDLNSPAAARAGIAAGVLAYIIWGLMPIYWRLLGEASSLEILCLRIIGSLVFILLNFFVFQIHREKPISPTVVSSGCTFHH